MDLESEQGVPFFCRNIKMWARANLPHFASEKRRAFNEYLGINTELGYSWETFLAVS